MTGTADHSGPDGEGYRPQQYPYQPQQPGYEQQQYAQQYDHPPASGWGDPHGQPQGQYQDPYQQPVY
ncbi:hypothetical protein P3T29_004380, partial [Kitasatospora sp. MAP5-34]|nr:hypothetical protein [Kitasatospora sp. MAP5-34]